MRFLVTRASDRNATFTRPCEEAVPGRLLTWQKNDIRSRISPHRIYNPPNTFQEWFVEFNTLDELATFAEKYEEIIISKNDYPDIEESVKEKPEIFDGMHILIYDAYIE
jgi:hypothetical protein